MKEITAKLPVGLRQKWRDRADVITEEERREVTIGDIADFVERKARVANHPVFGDVHTGDSRNTSGANNPRNKPKIPTRTMKGSTFVTQGNATTNQSEPAINSRSFPSKLDVKCLLCGSNHWLTRCEVFKGNPFSERLAFVRKKGLCDNCLVPGHMASSCPKQSYCQNTDCKFSHRKHSTFLHPRNESSNKVEVRL